MLRRDVGTIEVVGAGKKTPRRSKKNTKIFLNIDKEGKSIPAVDETLRKGVLTVSRGKALFSTDQLIQVCKHMFEDLPFVAFKGPTDAHPYVVVIFSANCQYGDVCEVKTRLELFKKEAAVENFLIRFKVDLSFHPKNIFNIYKIDHPDSSLEMKTAV